ncbi:MAG: SDR family NAD(P)-dependent oxidoreductase [Acidimicrobiaceae bacterium]|nr:SDR family NAD(P)-dependent oxidoreductase [Acidimicrobiaceae bacterium]
MSGHLEGRTIAVTGGGGGIGRAVSLACAAEGANVVVADYGVSLDGSDPSSEVAESAVRDIRSAGGEAIAVAGDVSRFDVGAAIVEAACDQWGTIDGVVCPAGVLRERMLFNMSEDEWDHVVAVHLKGHFNVYRAALARMRKQPSGGSLVGFTSGAFSASTAQANYSAAKGGIVSLTRSAAMTAASIRLRGGPAINANCIAPTARTRMSENVPFEIETGEPEAVAPMAVFLLFFFNDTATTEIYTVVGRRISVWNQPEEVRSMWSAGDRWTPDEIAESLPRTIGQEPNPMIADLERRMAEMAGG